MWNTVRTADDIERLLTEYGGFHDCCVTGLEYESSAGVDADAAMFSGEKRDHVAVLSLQSQWKAGTLELRFEGVVRIFITAWQENYFCDIFDCTLEIRTDLITGRDDPLVVWADRSGFDPKRCELKPLSEPSVSYVIADVLKWRIV